MSETYELLESILFQTSAYLALFVELWGILLIVITLLRALKCFIFDKHFDFHMMKLDASLNHGLSVALEFLLTAEILKTIYSPSLEELIEVVVLVLIRVFISFILQYECKHKETEK